MSSNVGTTIRLGNFLHYPMDAFMSAESKLNSHMSTLFTLNLSFLLFRRNLDYALKPLLSAFGGFWKKKENNACFNLGLVIHSVLRAFAVWRTAIVTTATAFTFFRSFSCFV